MEKSLIPPLDPNTQNQCIRENLEKIYSREQAAAMNPLALAYVGDGIFSDAVRKYLLGSGHQNVNLMTKTSILYVKASAQAEIIRRLLPKLTADEERIVKRGRNTASQVPKNADPSDYRYATGFEALIGYLYLCGDFTRMNELIIESIAIINQTLGL